MHHDLPFAAVAVRCHGIENLQPSKTVGALELADQAVPVAAHHELFEETMRFPSYDHHDFGTVAFFQALCKRTGDAEGGEVLCFDIEMAAGCLQCIMREPDGF